MYEACTRRVSPRAVAVGPTTMTKCEQRVPTRSSFSMEGHTESVLQTNGGGRRRRPYQIEFDKLLLTTGATMSRSFANGDDATDKVSPQPVMPARATEQPKSTASSPLKSNLELLSSTPLISSTFAATANNQEGGGGDVQTTCSTTRKALGDFHIRSRPPSPPRRKVADPQSHLLSRKPPTKLPSHAVDLRRHDRPKQN